MTLWEIDIHPGPGQPDRAAHAVHDEIRDLRLLGEKQLDRLGIHAARGFLIEGNLERHEVQRLAAELLADEVVERTVIGLVGDPLLSQSPTVQSPTVEPSSEVSAGLTATVVQVLPKPGVMDPVAQSALAAIGSFGISAEAVRTFRKYWLGGLDEPQLAAVCRRVLANDSIEQLVLGPLALDRLQCGSDYQFALQHVPLRELDDEQLMQLSRQGQLYLTLVEMQTIQQHFRRLEREPTDVELETIAQTWSEHCSHKTLAGRIAYRDEQGERHYQNMLRETIFAATQTIRQQLGEADWCVSVFRDNAGVVQFDDEYNVVFKVETHNHPSALEPYGGANTGIGGVIRDPLGTGLGAKPICNTDVFCFAPPDTSANDLPEGVLHPRRVMKGVVSGVRDYGNRMGIPTVNGAIYFDPRYLGNPLVYCGNVGLLPVDKTEKAAQAGDWIVAIGGRTGRDGIHGATFSSAELTSESESVSGGAVQIGNAITEKMVLDVLLQARDRGLYHAVTDCGAGGFSSAVGEMGEELGAVVWLDRAPLKYDGLSYTEIWISEAQERMVLSVPDVHWETLRQLCEAEGVEATRIGQFVPTGRLELRYADQVVGDLSMKFLHGGRPPVVRDAVYEPSPSHPFRLDNHLDDLPAPGPVLHQILSSLNVASKEWVIRQYDHEVQGGSVVKPLVGVSNDGPSDAAVVRPRLESRRGLVISCGMNPHYGELDTYHMAASAIDEAVRNAVAVGAAPDRIAILDNFCWGYTDRPETLGSLVRAAIACHDVAIALGTPFISGKDSLNNEFSFSGPDGARQTISIPPSLLISALGQVDDVRHCVTMDWKRPGNSIYLLGNTRQELGGSHFALVTGGRGGRVPKLDPRGALQLYHALHRAIREGWIRSCHDLSEGGLAVAAAEMAFAGGLGAELSLDQVPNQLWDDHAMETVNFDLEPLLLLFSESNSRFLVEVAEDCEQRFIEAFQGLPCGRLGQLDQGSLRFTHAGRTVLNEPLEALKGSWQAPLNWH